MGVDSNFANETCCPLASLSVKSGAFCPTCGSPIYLTLAAMPDLFAVHAASLDDPGRFKPQMVMYGVRGHAWDHLDPALPKFDKMPPPG